MDARVVEYLAAIGWMTLSLQAAAESSDPDGIHTAVD